MKAVGVQILLHAIEYLIWLPFIASLSSTTSGALSLPVEVQNAARMMHEVLSEFDNGGPTAGTSVHQTMLEHTKKIGRKQVANNCVQRACRNSCRKDRQRLEALTPSPRTSKLSFGHLLLPPKCAQELFYPGNYLEQPPALPAHSCIV